MHTQNIRTAASESTGIWGKSTDSLPPFRGLHLRIKWGQARVLESLDPQKAKYEMSEACYEAEREGRVDFHSGKEEPPVMFLDVPKLVNAWAYGWNSAASREEMNCCPGCQNESGDPCPIHDDE